MDKNKENVMIPKIVELLREAKTDDGTFYGSLYDLYVYIGITKGVNDINNKQEISIEELDKEMETLYENSIRKFG